MQQSFMFLYPWMQHTQMPCPDSLLTFSPIPTPVYSGVTVTLLAQHNHLPSTLAMYYCTVCALALASHSKTMFTDPGAVPPSAVPLQTSQCQTHSMCSHCQSFKPPVSHHCRICNRCISRMDHHCPWMNNCVGAGNLSEFVACGCVLHCRFADNECCEWAPETQLTLAGGVHEQNTLSYF
jgi:hypothetical protein